MGVGNGYGFANQGTGGGGGGGGTIVYVDITYAALNALFKAGAMAAGTYYLITDFQTVYDQPDFYYSQPLSNTNNPKTNDDVSAKTGPIEPIAVFAVTSDELAPQAQSTIYPLDTLKYDITFSRTEQSGALAKGRITERISAPAEGDGSPIVNFGCRTDYDWRVVEYKRYATFDSGSILSGDISTINTNIVGDIATTTLHGIGTTFLSDFVAGDIIYFNEIDTSLGRVRFFKAKIASIDTDTRLVLSDIDTTKYIYLPTQLSTSYEYSKAVNAGQFLAYAEQYAGQSIDGDYADNILTFTSDSINMFIGNNADYYSIPTIPQQFLLPNSVFINSSISIFCGCLFRNNTIAGANINANYGDSCEGNLLQTVSTSIVGNVFSNNILNSIYASTVGENFSNNLLSFVSNSTIGNNIVAAIFPAMDGAVIVDGINGIDFTSLSLALPPTFNNNMIALSVNVVDSGTGGVRARIDNNGVVQTSSDDGNTQIAFSTSPDGAINVIDILQDGHESVISQTVLTNSRLMKFPDAAGIIQTNTVVNATYGVDVDLSAVTITGGIYNYEFQGGGSSPVNFLLPINTNAGIGTIIEIGDLASKAFSSNITIDAGTGNTINSATTSQTFVIDVDGQFVQLEKITDTQWKLQINNTGGGFGTLQQVTTNGNTTDQDIILLDSGTNDRVLLSGANGLMQVNSQDQGSGVRVATSPDGSTSAVSFFKPAGIEGNIRTRTLTDIRTWALPDNFGLIQVENVNNSQVYGVDVDLSALVVDGGINNYQFSSGTGATNFLLPIDTNATIGTIFEIGDLIAIAAANNITIDAGIGNTINGATIAQTFVMDVNGQFLQLEKITDQTWKIQINTAAGVGNLQQVTDGGNTTTNNIIVSDGVQDRVTLDSFGAVAALSPDGSYSIVMGSSANSYVSTGFVYVQPSAILGTMISLALSLSRLWAMPDAEGIVVVNKVFQPAYGSTTDESALFFWGGIRNFSYHNGSATSSTFLLPTGTNASQGTIYQFADRDGIAANANITIDAGTGNTINGEISAQTFVMNVNGQFIQIEKIDNTTWSLQINTGSGLQSNLIQTVTTDTTIDTTYCTVLVDATGGNVTITLPTAASNYNATTKQGDYWIVKRIDVSVNTVTIKGDGAELIDFSNTQLVTSGAFYKVQTDGTQYWIV